MINMYGLITKVFGLLVISMLLGCGSKYEVVPVSGRITLDGKPLANASIFTQPTNRDTKTPGPGSGGLTDENGEFELEFQTEDKKGAIPGDTRITIIENAEQKESNDDTGVAFKRKVPEEYRDGKVNYTIPEEGTDAMNFDLSSKKKR